jgi:hypothetical protein
MLLRKNFTAKIAADYRPKVRAIASNCQLVAAFQVSDGKRYPRRKVALLFGAHDAPKATGVRWWYEFISVCYERKRTKHNAHWTEDFNTSRPRKHDGSLDSAVSKQSCIGRVADRFVGLDPKSLKPSHGTWWPCDLNAGSNLAR